MRGAKRIVTVEAHQMKSDDEIIPIVREAAIILTVSRISQLISEIYSLSARKIPRQPCCAKNNSKNTFKCLKGVLSALCKNCVNANLH